MSRQKLGDKGRKNFLVKCGGKTYGPYAEVDAETVRAYLRQEHPDKKPSITTTIWLSPRKAKRGIKTIRAEG